MKEAGFKNIEILDEKPYSELEQEKQKGDGRKITSLAIKAIKE